jgi:hypothetical protein
MKIVFSRSVMRWNWHSQALCRGEPTEIFFASDSDRGARRLVTERRAKQICRSCPVLDRCRKYALDAREPYGIWGATTPTERRRLLARNADGP